MASNYGASSVEHSNSDRLALQVLIATEVMIITASVFFMLGYLIIDDYDTYD